MGKVIFTGLLVFVIAFHTRAQEGIGIGTTSPDPSAILELDSDNKGLLLPRVTALPAAPADGLVVYNTGTGSLYARENGRWYDVFPRGGIIMWSGDPDNLPQGWVLCDGSNGTPNLSGRFIVSYQSGSNDYGTVGSTGGADKVTLTANQSGLRAHNHTASASGDSHTHTIYGAVHEDSEPITYESGKSDHAIKSPVNPKGNTVTASSNYHTHTITVDEVAASSATESHENRPPYYVLAFIMKLY